jgi:hypothetical protein
VIDYLDDAVVDGDFTLSDEGVAVASVTASESSVYLLLTNGAVLACGENSRGQLGIGREDGVDDDDDDDDDFGSVDVPVPVFAGGLLANATAVYSGPTSHGAILVDGRYGGAIVRAVGYGGSGAAAGGGWIVPATLTACAGYDDWDGATTTTTTTTIAASRSGSTDGRRVVAIAIGNDHALFLASAGTSFDCGDGAPTASAPPTTPSPTTSPGPTVAPTTSSSPTASPFPTFVPSDGGGSTGPTTASSLPLAFDAPAPSAPIEMQTRNAAHGRLGYSSMGGFASRLLGVALSPIVIWHWF